jgi:hypothetical protein
VIAPAQQVESPAGILGDARVMSGGQGGGPQANRAIEQGGELQVAVAVRTRNRRPAGDVLADEVGDHCVIELRFEVEDVVGNADRRGDAPGIVQVVDGAARAVRSSGIGGAAGVVVQLHRHSDHVVTLLGQQRRGDR